ncbi:TetR/AcrR family transcriptional regulator [Risungbinella massiliensis]|uniref:TetR/AcrR family transcriptional regulator n=1 Tax=Risungbinella massiliensis TaxID=1329796 RepID=UPI0005CBD9EC|nr:TetR/AcrR family transcriptional regulator [Risungbinella massiliensis]
MTKKTDLRIIRTRKMIRDAFLELILEKGYESITIQHIANHAMINRATFYLHYTDKHNLLAKISEETLQELSDTVQLSLNQERQVNVSKLQNTIVNVCQHIQKNALFYRAMLGQHGVPNFYFRIQQVMKEKLQRAILEFRIPEEELSIPKEIYIQFTSSAFVGMIVWWLDQNMIFSPEHMASLLSKVITMGPVRALGFTPIQQ